MTSVANFTAHVTDNKELVVRTVHAETGKVLSEVVLENGGNTTIHVYDQVQVVSFERLKEEGKDEAES